jgi:hypothetical protein
MKGIFRETRGRETSAVGNRYQATDSEDYSMQQTESVSYNLCNEEV